MYRSDAPLALFDSNLDGERAIRLTGCVGHVRCTDPAQLHHSFTRIEQAGRDGRWVALAASYELGYALEPALAPLRPEADTPLLEAWFFEQCESLTDAHVEAWLAEAPGPAGLLDFRPLIDEPAYLEAVRQIQALIAAGDCYQANFTFPCHARAYGERRALYRQLRDAQPVRYGAYIEHVDGVLLSRSPELFVERSGSTLTCRPMKGTAPASAPPEALTRSAKNRAENVMIVDLIRNDLGRLAAPGNVSVPRLFTAEPYKTLWQMTSTVQARNVRADLETVFHALFPCGSVTGAPKIRAMQIIRGLEATPRGVYCGAIGWIAPNGDFGFNVPIRTLDIRPDGLARYGTGSGIVHDSDPSAEWRECLLKTRFLHDLHDALGLIETLRCNGGTGNPLPWLDDHLARLNEAARSLGIPADIDAIARTLWATAASLVGPHRLRLVLSADGSTHLTHAPLETTPHQPTVILANTPLRANRALNRFKTTLRRQYDETLKQAMADGHFDAIFLSEDGQLVEGCRSTLFLEIDGQLYTPPLSVGALDGVCRRRLLRSGLARERRLKRADLTIAERIYLGNALRGLVEVRLTGD